MKAQSARSLLRGVLILLVSAALAGSLAGRSLAAGEVSDREVEEGALLAGTSVLARDGASVAIPAEEGLTVVLFWATWSPRSKLALDLWGGLKEKYASQPLTVVTVNAEKDELSAPEREQIDRYIQDNAVRLPVVMDEGLRLFDAYAVKALPTAFFLDREGKLLYRYPSFPTSAAMDLEEELQVRLGLKDRPSQEEVASRGKLDYQPKNNALLHYNMGVQLFRKGYEDKALERFVIALQKDPDYGDPLRTLEGVFFHDGRTPEAEQKLRDLLREGGLEDLFGRIGEGEPVFLKERKKTGAMERMRQLMEERGMEPAPAGQ